MYIATGKGGYFFSSRKNTVIIFHLISIVKYNNIIYLNIIIIHIDVRNTCPVSNIIYVNVIMIYSNVRNPGPLYNIIYVNLIIIYSNIHTLHTNTWPLNCLAWHRHLIKSGGVKISLMCPSIYLVQWCSHTSVLKWWSIFRYCLRNTKKQYCKMNDYLPCV